MIPFLRPLILFVMGFLGPSVLGGGGMMASPHHNFIVFALMTMKLGTAIELDKFYTIW